MAKDPIEAMSVKYYAARITKDNGDGTSDMEFPAYSSELELLEAGHSRIFFKGIDIEFQQYMADSLMKDGFDVEFIKFKGG